MTLVIMAAGLGSRFGGLKQLTPLTDDNEYMIDFTVFDAIRAGFDKVVIVIKPEHEADFEEKIGARIRKAGVNIRYAYQKNELPAGFKFPEGRKKPMGTGHAILSIGKITEPFAVVNADDFYGYDPFEKLASFLRSGNGEWCMVGYKLKNTLSHNGSVSRGVCVTDGDYLKTITENKKIELKNGRLFNTWDDGTTSDLDPEQLVSMTCFGFTPDFYDGLHDMFIDFLTEHGSNLTKCEFFLPAAVQNMISNGKKMKMLDTDAEWNGVTYKEDGGQFREFIRAHKAAGHYPKNLW